MYTMTTPIKLKNKKVDPYTMQQVMSASPAQVITYIYDAAITACSRQDRDKILRATSELIRALNFDYKEQASVFYRVYRHISNLASRGDFESARLVLADVRDAWNQALKGS